jgi:hypothetical protein
VIDLIRITAAGLLLLGSVLIFGLVRDLADDEED